MSKEIECENVSKVSMGQNLLEWGFLWAIFFAPWGPVLRYFGWLLALVGLIILKVRGVNLNRLSLAPLDRVLLAFFSSGLSLQPLPFKGIFICLERVSRFPWNLPLACGLPFFCFRSQKS